MRERAFANRPGQSSSSFSSVINVRLLPPSPLLPRLRVQKEALLRVWVDVKGKNPHPPHSINGAWPRLSAKEGISFLH